VQSSSLRDKFKSNVASQFVKKDEVLADATGIKHDEIQVSETEMKKLIEVIKNDDTNKTHLLFWFASPLKPPIKSKSHRDLPLLNFKSEYEGIKNALKKINRKVKFSQKVATKANFAKILDSSPLVLHFSGHGVKVHTQLSNNKNLDSGDGGDYLVIEDEYCHGEEFNQKMLMRILQESNLEIQVAVVLSCHSEYIGQIFLKAGIKHVICVGREFKIDDKACIAFASSFYTQLFSRHNSTICQAFDTAVAAVGTEFGKEGFAGEEHKFRCITDHKKEMCEVSTAD